jgi:hypothetical protein
MTIHHPLPSFDSAIPIAESLLIMVWLCFSSISFSHCQFCFINPNFTGYQFLVPEHPLSSPSRQSPLATLSLAPETPWPPFPVALETLSRSPFFPVPSSLPRCSSHKTESPSLYFPEIPFWVARVMGDRAPQAALPAHTWDTRVTWSPCAQSRPSPLASLLGAISTRDPFPGRRTLMSHLQVARVLGDWAPSCLSPNTLP